MNPSEERLLAESEKVERTGTDLKRRTADVKRQLRRRGDDASIAVDVQGLHDHARAVDSMLAALTAKYSLRAQRDEDPSGFSGGSNSSVAVAREQLVECIRAAQIHVSQALELPLPGTADPPVAGRELTQRAVQRGTATAAASPIPGATVVQQTTEQIDEYDEREREALRELVSEAREVRLLQEEVHRITVEQQVQLDAAQSNIDHAERKISSGRLELSTAAKYKMTAMTITGAVVGGLIAGPVGALAGAKSVAGVMACAAAGTATGAIATRQVTTLVQEKLEDQRQALLADRPNQGPHRAAIE